MNLTHLWIRNSPDSDAMKKENLEARKAFAAEVLRSGEPLNQETRDAIAELLELETSRRGRPTKPPLKWYEVGKLLENSPDLTQQQAADEMRIELRTLQKGWRYYKQARKAHDDALKDEL